MGGSESESGSGKAVRSSDLARKHREVQREEDLRNLSVFVEKLVLGQLNVVFCANTRRWAKSVTLFASKHLVALERVFGSWKGLANEVMSAQSDEKVNELVIETLANEDEEEDGTEEDEKREEMATEIETENGDEKEKEKEDEEAKRRAEEEERERLERERKDAEAAAEAERVRKEKEEALEKERAANKKKMEAMFQDGDDKPADSEFP